MADTLAAAARRWSASKLVSWGLLELWLQPPATDEGCSSVCVIESTCALSKLGVGLGLGLGLGVEFGVRVRVRVKGWASPNPVWLFDPNRSHSESRAPQPRPRSLPRPRPLGGLFAGVARPQRRVAGRHACSTRFESSGRSSIRALRRWGSGKSATDGTGAKRARTIRRSSLAAGTSAARRR
eukprot:scaffold10494_cov53-Phaeocystis_antarctica.AAC.3